jgi:1-acyl-sn-glycerol-3-phosphate acyltransferase
MGARAAHADLALEPGIDDVDLTDAAIKAIELASRLGGNIGSIVAPGPEIDERIERIPTRLGPYGVDPFGFDPQYLKRVVGIAVWLYRSYFRCQTFGVDNVPDGRCFIVANHSGQLPFDAAMVNMAVLLEREPPRFLRAMLERFVPSVPYVSVFMTRTGQILGTPENCRRLLEAEEAILVFPEGVRGLNKTWRERYRLQRFGQGFVRLALEMNAPIVPAVVIGAEEQAVSLCNLKRLGRLFGMPSIPITPTHPLIPGLGLLPLPTRYRIYFGRPIRLEGDANDEDEVIAGKVGRIKSTMQRMIDEGLTAREHVFW